MTKKNDNNTNIKKKLGNLSLLKIIIITSSIAIIGTGVFLWIKSDKSAVKNESDTAQNISGNNKSVFFDIDDLIVKLKDSGNYQNQFLKIAIVIESLNNNTKNEIPLKLAKIKDEMILILKDKTMQEIQTIEGKISLRNDLIRKVNKILQKGTIRNLYFTEFLIN